MKPKEDAFGEEILAYLLQKKGVEIIERDDGFVSSSDILSYYFSDYEGWVPMERDSIKLAKGRVLDVGCGAGRVCLYLQKQGLEVTGMDISPKAIEVCKKRGVERALVLPVERIDSFRPDSFDTIVMFGNNFALLGSQEKARALLKKMYRITSRDAVILAGNRDPYSTKDAAHLAYHELNRRRGRMAGQLRMRVRFRQYVGEWFDYLFVSRKELKGILLGTGWKAREFIGSRGPLYVAVIVKESWY